MGLTSAIPRDFLRLLLVLCTFCANAIDFLLLVMPSGRFFRARELGVMLIETSLTSLHSLLITVITYHRMPSMAEEQIRGSANDSLPMLSTCLPFSTRIKRHIDDTALDHTKVEV
jgi:hypothetical protein